MLFRVRELIRNAIIFLFMAKRNDLKEIATTDFNPVEYKKKHIANSSVITMYDNGNETLFFRECRKHQKIKPYLKKHIEEYFDNICNAEDKEELKIHILEDLLNRSNYRKAISITTILNDRLIEILSGTYCDYNATGFTSFANREEDGEFIPFVQYFSCVLISQRINGYLKFGMHENFNANKQLATYHFARLLDIEHMVPQVWVSRFFDGDRERIGTMMKKAKGVPPSGIQPQDRTNYDKETFLKDLTTLEFFDALCYQLDHRLDNYYVTTDERGRINHTVAFDNDAARTFFVSPFVPKCTYAGAVSVIDKDGEIPRPFMDKSFAEKLLSISVNDVKRAIGEYLSSFQFYCLCRRMTQMKKAILKTAKQREDFLVADWSKVDEGKLIDKSWGKTYYSLYLNDTLMLDREIEFEKMRKDRKE